MKVEPIPGEHGRFWVQSESRPDVKHIVDILWKENPNDPPRARCSCEQMAAKKKPTCKHVETVAEFIIAAWRANL